MKKSTMKVFVGTKSNAEVKRMIFASKLSKGHTAGRVYLTDEGKQVLEGWMTNAN
jgi:hypothetical protein